MEGSPSNDNKLIAISSILQVYSALLGMTDEDFQDLTHQIGETYSGPLPDGYSQEVLEHYQGTNKHE